MGSDDSPTLFYSHEKQTTCQNQMVGEFENHLIIDSVGLSDVSVLYNQQPPDLYKSGINNDAKQ